jgi:hypothetical protein
MSERCVHRLLLPEMGQYDALGASALGPAVCGVPFLATLC